MRPLTMYDVTRDTEYVPSKKDETVYDLVTKPMRLALRRIGLLLLFLGHAHAACPSGALSLDGIQSRASILSLPLSSLP